MAGVCHSALRKEQLIGLVRKLAYELSQKEDMLKAMRWLINLESEKTKKEERP